MNASQEQEKIAPEIVVLPESHRQPIWHVIILNVFTMFGYSLIWFYKNCSQLAGLDRKIVNGEIAVAQPGEAGNWPAQDAKAAMATLTKVNPVLFTVGLLVPVVQLVLVTIFFTTAARLYPGERPLTTLHPWLCGIALTLSMLGLLCCGALPGFAFLAYLTAAIPLAFTQYLLNAFWQTIEPEDHVVRQAFSGGELFMLITGSVLLGLVVTGLVNH